MYSHWSPLLAPALFLTEIRAAIGPRTWSSPRVHGGRQRRLFRYASDWPAACADVTALPADRSEKPVWREELDRRERPGREPWGAASCAGWDRPTGYSDWTVFLFLSSSSFFLRLTPECTRYTKWQSCQGELAGFASRRNLWNCQKKNWLRVKVWLRVCVRLLHRIMLQNRLFLLDSGESGPRLLYLPVALKILFSHFH